MKLKVDDYRRTILADTSRFKTICAGRRWGKTYVSLAFLLMGEIQPYERRWFIAPTYKQGKLIAWDIFKRLISGLGVSPKINETEMKVVLDNHAEFRIMGADREDALRGTALHKVVLDEYAYMKPHVFQEIILPMLADTKGSAIVCGTPAGYDHFYRLFMNAQTDDEWSAFQYKTIDGGNVAEEEIKRARKQMDERTFRQEFEASFETYEGALYYNFDESSHTSFSSLYSKVIPIHLTCDFNKSPMVWLVTQLMEDVCLVVNELSIPHNAKTEQLAQMFCNKYKDHQNRLVYLTGDSANNYETHRDFTTDYVIIKNILESHGFRVILAVPKKNPNINNRVNVVCSMIDRGKLIISDKCNYLINDMNINQSDGKGGKDKSDPQQTHASDCLDYLIWQYFAGKFYKTGVKQL